MLVCNLIMILAGLITAKFFSELMRVPGEHSLGFIISFCLLGALPAQRYDGCVVYDPLRDRGSSSCGATTFLLLR